MTEIRTVGKLVTIIKKPTVVVLAEMKISERGAMELAGFLANTGGCGVEASDVEYGLRALVKHGGMRDNEPGVLTDNEILAELAGRKCYNSFGDRIGRPSNAAYIANILGAPGKIPHASVLYHAKMTFFFGGISRRMTHELIRHYVGADRTEEGCPSQESTRYTEHPGSFVAHPRHLLSDGSLKDFEHYVTGAYDSYLEYLSGEVDDYKADHNSEEPKGMERKRIYEAAAALLPGAASTSMIWTTNPVALQKLFNERTDEAADLEFQRFATLLKSVCLEHWPNLFRESNPFADKA